MNLSDPDPDPDELLLLSLSLPESLPDSDIHAF